MEKEEGAGGGGGGRTGLMKTPAARVCLAYSAAL